MRKYSRDEIRELGARPAPESNFDRITKRPLNLANFILALELGRIPKDFYCNSHSCAESCPTEKEIDCIAEWLEKPAGAERP